MRTNDTNYLRRAVWRLTRHSWRNSTWNQWGLVDVVVARSVMNTRHALSGEILTGWIGVIRTSTSRMDNGRVHRAWTMHLVKSHHWTGGNRGCRIELHRDGGSRVRRVGVHERADVNYSIVSVDTAILWVREVLPLPECCV